MVKVAALNYQFANFQEIAKESHRLIKAAAAVIQEATEVRKRSERLIRESCQTRESLMRIIKK